MDPVAALTEIAYLLERARESSFKTKAFRRAAEALAAIPEDERLAKLESGQLAKTKGIGGSSLEVIRQAFAGGIPERLVEERERSGGPLVDGGAEVRAALRGDLHSHSDWSDGTTSIQSMVDTAMWLGHEYLVLTDHSPRLRIANGLSAERLSEQLAVVAEIDGASDGFRLLSGIEVDILDDGALDQTDAMLERLDVVVASVHSKLAMDSGEMTERMLAAVRNPRTNVLGHCTGRLIEGLRGTRPGSTFDAEAVFAACAEASVAVEINSRPERRDPPGELLELALAAGCLFSIDSDAHAPGHLGLIDFGAARAEAHGVPVDRIVNTWPVDRLLAWARS